ncbi:MAG TPA: N-6 DNA methylase [Terriglobia bacterium]|nr:N-6 DNA methylase [Terriglobia bacterium]
MPASRESFSQALERLIHKFEANNTHYLSKSYLEAQARVDLISPFFKALGWDMENEAGLSHHEREVIVERGETEGYPDYNFRVGGQTKFFVEAKAPSEPLDTTKHILQAKGYAWNTKQVFFVVLTDFEEFRFYDASIKPDERNPDEGLLLKLNYSDYLKNIEKLWEFSRERVAAGSLDAMLPRGLRKPRLRLQVDEVFLDEMTGWREDLAKNIFKNNPDLTAKQLNEVVQRLLDRVVFIRIAEDRHIIEKRQLADAVDEWKARGGKLHLFDWLNDLFHKINEDFNGEIFKPHLSETIKIDSEVLAKIIERLYPPKSPYRFDVIGVELLGSIYERYLGKTIRVTPKQARVEEKPEVRKAGGVYYTPKYIVDYIVKNTVGKIIEGKTPKQIEKIRILDPACGSGSFLIGAFQCLIDYHVKWYLAHPEQEVRHAHPSLDFMREVHTNPDGGHRLSVYRKAKILRNNLFGVDIDPQAVEITMMSLYLKALEGEMSQLPPKQHLLPELKYNIICGNSLIGPDIYDQGTLFGDEERDRINAFDWISESVGFGRIMKEGGFSCVVANPPYIRIQTLQAFSPIEAEYLKRHYASAVSGNFDIYVCFVERGVSALRKEGSLGFILPSKFFQTDYGASLREILVRDRLVEKVVDFGHLQVFDGPTTYTCLLFLAKGAKQNIEYLKIESDQKLQSLEGTKTIIPPENLPSGPWVFAGRRKTELFRKLEKGSTRLIDLPVSISRGSSSGADDLFVLAKTPQAEVYVTKEGESVRLESDILRVPLYATDFGRFTFAPAADERIIFPYEINNGTSSLIPEKEFKSRFPRAYEYLHTRRKRLELRQQFTEWYSYSAPRSLPIHDSAHLLVPLLADRGLFAEFPLGQNRFCLMASGGFSIKLGDGVPVSPKYLLGLLNSKLLFTYLKSNSNVFRGGWITCTKQYVAPLPIRVAEKGEQDRIVGLVDRMLKCNKQKHSGKLAPSQTDRMEREIVATDAEIDAVVYELYGITDDERKIIQGV